LILNDNYIEFGPLKQEQLADILKVTDITILLSKEEPQGMVMVESISSGCITISSKVGGIVDTIQDSYNGFLVNNPISFNEVMLKIEYVLNNLKEIDYINKNARKSAIKKFDWKISTLKLEEIYNDIYEGKE
jgi:glycosyltransferase involved in cell wall biosynthesis